ncbi:MAG: hypothetical protein IKK24_00095 [Clostridia bacterium]|nr:hypothetical protein [Clostridia bacterium]
MSAKRILNIVITVLLIINLCGCDFFTVDTEQLLNPPALTGDMKPIQEALSHSITGDYTLKYPSGGDYRSAVIMNDIDNDGMFEAFAFYSQLDGDVNCMHINTICRDGDDWVSVSDHKVDAGGVDSVDFSDLNSDGVMEIIVGWEIYGSTDKQVAVYSFENKTLLQRLIHPYTSFLCCDLDENGENELFIHHFNAVEPINEALLYTLENDGVVQLSGCAMDITVKTVTEPILSVLSTGQPAVYVDETKASGTVTEVLYMSKGTLVNPLLDSKTGENTRTIRTNAAPIADINKDEIIEIPITELMLWAENTENTEKVYYTNWCSFNGEKLVNQMTTLLNMTDGYYLKVPERWIGHISLVRDNEHRSRQIYAYNPEKKSIGAALAYFVAVPLSGWDKFKENSMDIIEISRNDTYVFAGKVYNGEGALYITEDELKEMFFLY